MSRYRIERYGVKVAGECKNCGNIIDAESRSISACHDSPIQYSAGGLHVIRVVGRGCVMKVDFDMDEDLKYLSERKAKSMGLTLGELVIFLLSKETDFRKKIDDTLEEIEREGFEPAISVEEFIDDIKAGV